ncbi:hypothetical protein WJX82_011212 [Trebouxia sp. C0006]
MRLPTNQICREAPSTSYSCSRCPIVPRLTPRSQSKGHRKQRATSCCSSGHEDFQTQEAWNRLELITRKLAVAVSEEDYPLAAQLSSEKQSSSQDLPPVSQYTFHQLQELQKGLETGDVAQQYLAVRKLGGTGDKFALPYLLACLKHGRLSSVAFDAIYAIFMWHPNPEITALMNQACSMISTKEAAVPILDRVIELEPMYYEAFNKRATASYLARDFEHSIDDCHRTLKLQPDHFLAMSGMGLCYAGLERWDEAIHWFQKSVTIHPHMDQIQTYITKLKSKGFGGTSLL